LRALARSLRRVDAMQRERPRVAFVVAVAKKFGDDEAGNLAALVSYYLFFSIFPLLLVFTTVVGLLMRSDPERQRELLDSALANIPVLNDQIERNIGHPQGNGITLAVGLAIALWGGLGALGAMQNAMNSIWDVPRRERPGFVQQRVRSLLLLTAFAVAVGASTLASSLVGGAGSLPVVGQVAALVPALAINALLFLGAFRILVNRTVPWSSVWPGALLAAVFFTALQTVGGAYVSHVIENAGPVYGSFAIVLGLLSFLYLQAQLTMVAAEVNVVRHAQLYPRGLDADLLTTADVDALERYAHTEERHPAESIDVSIDQEPIESIPNRRHEETV
jgi:YihY family inner membrane protein